MEYWISIGIGAFVGFLFVVSTEKLNPLQTFAAMMLFIWTAQANFYSYSCYKKMSDFYNLIHFEKDNK